LIFIAVLILPALLSCSGIKKVWHEDAIEDDVGADDAAGEGDAEAETIECSGDEDCDDGEVCNGRETCNLETHSCEPGTDLGDGYVCEAVGPRKICLSGACALSECGDGFVDTGGNEFCEPPGEGRCSGDCQLLCTVSDDCPDDGNVCNGSEYCDTGEGKCGHQNPPADGTECGETPHRICLLGTCQESMCGDGYVDSGKDPVEECEDGNGVSGDGCEPGSCRFSCHEASECNDGHDCTDDLCDTEMTHACTISTSSSGTPCRSVAGDCDVEEECDGETQDCPFDQFLASGTVCRTAAGICDVEETCSGTTAQCPEDAFLPSTTVCRSAIGQCDSEETCTGSTTECPADALQPAGYPCSDADPCTYPDECDGSGACASGPPSGLHDVASVSVNRGFACALMTAGGVKCWGGNNYGQLGDGTTTGRTTPVDVVGLSSGAAAVSAGYFHACAVTTAGGVKCWGNNNSGQLGDGTTTNRLTPADVVGLSSGVAAVSAGTYYTCALMITGGVKCWGLNNSGQLGDGTTTNKPTPVDVVGLSSGVADVSAGYRHTCVLMETGGVKCWGLNDRGQVGDGSTTTRLTPVDVWPLSSGVAAVSAGNSMISSHTCALMEAGGVKCWGGNIYGALGDGTTTDKFTPVDVAGLSSGVANISAGAEYSCVVTTAGSIMCWGDNEYGQLGDGTTTTRLTPVTVSGLSAGVVVVSAGPRPHHTCALMNTGGVMCWGDGWGLVPADVACE
jgi:alpha-tubulin suppressor-like RCC1 family protein